MKRIMLMTLAILMVGAPAFAGNPSIIAAKIHADWCGSCQTMGPAYEQVQKDLSGKDILFVTIDRTDDVTTANSKLLASALGISKITDSIEKTGSIVLINAKNNKKVGKLNKTHSAVDMGEIINGALAGKVYKDDMAEKGSKKMESKGSAKKGSAKGSGY